MLTRRLIFIEVSNPEGITSVLQVKALAKDLHKLYGIKEFIGVAWRGGNSDHEQGLALDIMPNCFPFMPRFRQRKTIEAVHEYLLSNTEKYNINYVIWQNIISERPKWIPVQNITNTKGRTRSDLHLDHIHVSFMKAGK